MDREKAFLVATPFKKRGKKSLKISDFIFALSLDLKWGSPEKVRALLREAEAEGMVKMEEESVFAIFDAEAVDVPLGFKPTTEEGILDQGIRLITSQTGMSRKEVIAMANVKQDSLKKLVELDAVVLLVAREMGIDVNDLAAKAYENLLARTRKQEFLNLNNDNYDSVELLGITGARDEVAKKVRASFPSPRLPADGLRADRGVWH